MANTYTLIYNAGDEINEILKQAGYTVGNVRGKFYVLEDEALRWDGSKKVSSDFFPKEDYDIVYNKYVLDTIFNKILSHNISINSHMDIRRLIDIERQQRIDADNYLQKQINDAIVALSFPNRATLLKIGEDAEGFLLFNNVRIPIAWDAVTGSTKPMIFAGGSTGSIRAGLGTTPVGLYSFITGKYGTSSTVGSLFAVANGTSSAQSLAFEILEDVKDGEGNITIPSRADFNVPVYSKNSIPLGDNSKRFATTEFVNSKVGSGTGGGSSSYLVSNFNELPEPTNLGEVGHVLEDSEVLIDFEREPIVYNGQSRASVFFAPREVMDSFWENTEFMNSLRQDILMEYQFYDDEGIRIFSFYIQFDVNASKWLACCYQDYGSYVYFHEETLYNIGYGEVNFPAGWSYVDSQNQTPVEVNTPPPFLEFFLNTSTLEDNGYLALNGDTNEYFWDEEFIEFEGVGNNIFLFLETCSPNPITLTKLKGDYISKETEGNNYSWEFKKNNVNNYSFNLISTEWRDSSVWADPPLNEWKYYQPIHLGGVTQDNLINIICPYESTDLFLTNKIYCIKQSEECLVFMADSVPNEDVAVQISIVG